MAFNKFAIEKGSPKFLKAAREGEKEFGLSCRGFNETLDRVQALVSVNPVIR